MPNKTRDASSIETTDQITEIMINQYDPNTLPYNIEMTVTMEVMLNKLTASNEELSAKSNEHDGAKVYWIDKIITTTGGPYDWQ